MTFPSHTGDVMLAFALHEAQTLAGNVKAQAENVRNRSLSDNINATEIMAFHGYLKRSLDRLNVLKTTAGIVQYAKDQFDDAGLEIVVEFNAMVAAIEANLTWIRLNLPASAGGFVEAILLETDDTQTDKTFTATQTAAFRTELDALIATID